MRLSLSKGKRADIDLPPSNDEPNRKHRSCCEVQLWSFRSLSCRCFCVSGIMRAYSRRSASDKRGEMRFRGSGALAILERPPKQKKKKKKKSAPRTPRFATQSSPRFNFSTSPPYLFMRVQEKLRVVQEHLLWVGDRGAAAALPLPVGRGDGTRKEERRRRRARRRLEDARPHASVPPPARAGRRGAQRQRRRHRAARDVPLADRGERSRCAFCCPRGVREEGGREKRSKLPLFSLSLWTRCK